MDKISKALKKLSKKQSIIVLGIIKLLISNDISSLDIKKLKGFDDIFRVRKSNIRIIFRKENNDIKILSIASRSEKTYKDF